MSELRVEEGTKLERDLRREEGEGCELAVHSDPRVHEFLPTAEKHEATG